MNNKSLNQQNEMEERAWDRLWSRRIVTFWFRKLVPKFEQLTHIPYRFNINKLLKEINLDKARILELGCGSGMNSVNLFKEHSCQKATLIDFSRQALNIAKNNTRHLNVDLIHSDIFNLNLKKKFDFVFSIGLIEHFIGTRRSEAIKIHRQFTKDSEFIMIIVPRKNFFSKALKFFNQIQGYKEDYFSDKEIEGLFKRNKLEVIKKNYMMLGMVFCYLLRCRR